jgi:hypothetical protein
MHRSFQLAALRHWSSQNQRLRAMEIQSSTWLRMKTVPRVFYWWRREVCACFVPSLSLSFSASEFIEIIYLTQAYLHKLARTSLYQRLIRLYFDKWRSHKARKMLLNAAETYKHSFYFIHQH